MPASTYRWSGRPTSVPRIRSSRCRNRRCMRPSVTELLSTGQSAGSLGGRANASQHDAAAVLGRPIAGVIDLDCLISERKIGQRLATGRGAFHEILDFLQVPARPFLFEADILPAGLPVDLLSDVDGCEFFLAGLVRYHMRVRRNVGKQRAA